MGGRANGGTNAARSAMDRAGARKTYPSLDQSQKGLGCLMAFAKRSEGATR